MFCNAFILLVLASYVEGAPIENVHLETISTIYLPWRYTSNGTAEYGFNTPCTEQLTFDPADKYIYVVGGNILHVIDARNVTSLNVVYHMVFAGKVDVTDIEHCGDFIFIGVDDKQDRGHGRVLVYRKYNSTLHKLELVHSITVGSLPDMVEPTSSCLKVLVAIEAEVFSPDGKTLIDPHGGVGIITFPTGDVAGTYSYTQLDFTAFNNRWQNLTAGGARFIYRENNNTFAQDLEPEYIAYNNNETIAYICLQENNAIAVVDLLTNTVTDIHPLGYKVWENSMFDASDRDNGINIRSWPVFGMYQPDSIKVINVKGKQYLVTANEGDSKDYSDHVPDGFNEEERLKDFSIPVNSSISHWADRHGFTGSLLRDANLGRLKATTMNGGTNPGAFYSFGARSFSIFDLDTFALVYDSQSDFEKNIKEKLPYIFNSNSKDSDKMLSETIDKRSDDKGPEIESLSVAHLDDGKVVIFVGSERPGAIGIYTITDDIKSIKFESLWTGIPKEPSETWESLFAKRRIAGVDPEDLKFYPAKQSPNGKPMLICAGSVSASVTILNVEGLDNGVVGGISGTQEILRTCGLMLILLLTFV